MNILNALNSFARLLSIPGEVLKNRLGYWLHAPTLDEDKIWLGRHQQEARRWLERIGRELEQRMWQDIGQERYDQPIPMQDIARTEEWEEWWQREVAKPDGGI